MKSPRKVMEVRPGVPTLEGAGVRLRRAFGFGHRGLRSLPHARRLPRRRSLAVPSRVSLAPPPGHRDHHLRGRGEVDHGDSLGNKGTIGPGEVQWMTAGSGIIHQEMPRGDARGRMGGFQLWANLPADHKMMDPRYLGLTSADIPVANRRERASR